MWAWFWNHCVNFCISPFPRSGTSPWIPITPSQSQDRNLNAEEPLKPALLHLPAPSLSLFQERQCLPSLAHTLLPCASVIDAAGDAAPAARGRCCRHADGGHSPSEGVRWPPASRGTVWWLLPSQLGSRSSSWYKSCQAASTPRILKHLGL